MIEHAKRFGFEEPKFEKEEEYHKYITNLNYKVFNSWKEHNKLTQMPFTPKFLDILNEQFVGKNLYRYELGETGEKEGIFIKSRNDYLVPRKIKGFSVKDEKLFVQFEKPLTINSNVTEVSAEDIFNDDVNFFLETGSLFGIDVEKAAEYLKESEIHSEINPSNKNEEIQLSLFDFDSFENKLNNFPPKYDTERNTYNLNYKIVESLGIGIKQGYQYEVVNNPLTGFSVFEYSKDNPNAYHRMEPSKEQSPLLNQIQNFIKEQEKKMDEHIANFDFNKLSENGKWVFNNASNGMLAKYITTDEIDVINKFREYAAMEITGNFSNKTYFSQMWKLGQKFCQENGMEIPTIPATNKISLKSRLSSQENQHLTESEISELGMIINERLSESSLPYENASYENIKNALRNFDSKLLSSQSPETMEILLKDSFECLKDENHIFDETIKTVKNLLSENIDIELETAMEKSKQEKNMEENEKIPLGEAIEQTLFEMGAVPEEQRKKSYEERLRDGELTDIEKEERRSSAKNKLSNLMENERIYVKEHTPPNYAYHPYAYFNSESRFENFSEIVFSEIEKNNEDVISKILDFINSENKEYEYTKFGNEFAQKLLHDIDRKNYFEYLSEVEKTNETDKNPTISKFLEIIKTDEYGDYHPEMGLDFIKDTVELIKSGKSNEKDVKGNSVESLINSFEVLAADGSNYNDYSGNPNFKGKNPHSFGSKEQYYRWVLNQFHYTVYPFIKEYEKSKTVETLREFYKELGENNGYKYEPFVFNVDSESNIFKESHYSLKEFNEIISKDDKRKYELKNKFYEKYGRGADYYELRDSGKLGEEFKDYTPGYDKTFFVICIPKENPDDDIIYTPDRYDIGDGEGSVFDFIRKTCSYPKVINEMDRIENELYYPEYAVNYLQKDKVRFAVEDARELFHLQLEDNLKKGETLKKSTYVRLWEDIGYKKNVDPRVQAILNDSKESFEQFVRNVIGKIGKDWIHPLSDNVPDEIDNPKMTGLMTMEVVQKFIAKEIRKAYIDEMYHNDFQWNDVKRSINGMVDFVHIENLVKDTVKQYINLREIAQLDKIQREKAANSEKGYIETERNKRDDAVKTYLQKFEENEAIFDKIIANDLYDLKPNGNHKDSAQIKEHLKNILSYNDSLAVKESYENFLDSNIISAMDNLIKDKPIDKDIVLTDVHFDGVNNAWFNFSVAFDTNATKTLVDSLTRYEINKLRPHIDEVYKEGDIAKLHIKINKGSNGKTDVPNLDWSFTTGSPIAFEKNGSYDFRVHFSNQENILVGLRFQNAIDKVIEKAYYQSLEYLKNLAEKNLGKDLSNESFPHDVMFEKGYLKELHENLFSKEIISKGQEEKSSKWLTVEDVKLLNSWGYEDFDEIIQMQEAILVSSYELNGKKTTVNKAIENLGRDEFLSGISRSAFHWSAARNKNGNDVYFDSSLLFAEGKEYAVNREKLEKARREAKEHINNLKDILTKENDLKQNSDSKDSDFKKKLSDFVNSKDFESKTVSELKEKIDAIFESFSRESIEKTNTNEQRVEVKIVFDKSSGKANLKFKDKPDKKIRDELREANWLWSSLNGVWWPKSKDKDECLKFAKNFVEKYGLETQNEIEEKVPSEKERTITSFKTQMNDLLYQGMSFDNSFKAVFDANNTAFSEIIKSELNEKNLRTQEQILNFITDSKVQKQIQNPQIKAESKIEEVEVLKTRNEYEGLEK